MSSDRRVAVFRPGLPLAITSVALHQPGAATVGEADLEDLPEASTKPPISNGDCRLDALGQVAVHPVGRGDQELSVERVVGAGGEMEDPRVLEEAADDRADLDGL